MKVIFLATFVMVAIFTAGACSSSTEEKSSAKANSSDANANAAVQSGSDVSPPLAADPNAMNTAGAEPLRGPGANRLQGKFDAMRAGNSEPIDNAKVEAMAQKNARPAPDNSTFVSYLTDAGFEIRTFKNHPQLLRVEKRVGSDSQSLKVFLRGGRVVELPGNSISVLATATADAILSAAGVQQAPVQQKPGSAGGTDAKKPGN